MQFKGTDNEYGLVAQAIHWISAILIFMLIPIGALMAEMPESALKVLLFKIHITIGLTVLVLTLARVFWLFFDKRPIEGEHMTKQNYYLFKAIQIGMYFIVVLLTFSGFVLFIESGLVDVLLGTTNLIPMGLHHTTLAKFMTHLQKYS